MQSLLSSYDDNLDEQLSLFSDSGISTASSDSDTDFDGPNEDVMIEIIHKIKSQNEVFVEELINFSLKGAKMEEKFVRSSAMIFLWKVFKTCGNHYCDVTDRILTICPGVVNDLRMFLVDKYLEPELMFYVSGIVHYISMSKLGCQKLIDNCVGELFNFIPNKQTSITNYCIVCMHNILLNIPQSRLLFTCKSFVNILLELIDTDIDFKLELLIIDILSRLAIDNDSIKQRILEQGVLLRCVHLFVEEKSMKSFVMATQMIRIASTNCECKSFLISHRHFICYLVSELLVLEMKQSNCASALWSILLNLSDTLLNKINPHHFRFKKLIKKMIKFLNNILVLNLSSDVLEVVICCLSNFSCHQCWIKNLLINNNIQEILADLLDHRELLTLATTEACYRCLSHIISNMDTLSLNRWLADHPAIVPIGTLINPRLTEEVEVAFGHINLNDNGQVMASNQVDDDLLSALRSWCFMIRRIIDREDHYMEASQRKSINNEAHNLLESYIQILPKNVDSISIVNQRKISDICAHLNAIIQIG